MSLEVEVGKKVLLHVQGVRLYPDKRLITLDIYDREVIGLAGLEGQGQQEFLKTLCGLYMPYEGYIVANLNDGNTITITNNHNAAKAGVMYLPRQRDTEGILPTLSVFDNYTISTLSEKSKIGFINRHYLNNALDIYKKKLSMVFNSPSTIITNLSGGNRQKVLIARLMAVGPRVMLLNDPTRGVDHETKKILYEIFKEMAQIDKIAVVILSTEIEEFIHLCDRTFVFYNKELFTEILKTEISRVRIIEAMFGKKNGDENIQRKN